MISVAMTTFNGHKVNFYIRNKSVIDDIKKNKDRKSVV